MIGRSAAPAVLWAGLAVLVPLGFGAPAFAQSPEVLARLEQLNKRAMEDYDMLDFEPARKALTDAAALIKKNGLDNEPVAAKTYLNLGILTVAGLKDRYKGFGFFVKALQIKPDLKLDPAIATPELQEVFDNARETVGVPRSRPGGRPAEKVPVEKRPPEGDGVPEDVKGLVHKVVDEAPAGQPIAIKAQLGTDVQAARLFLFYRGPGREDYSAVPMSKKGKGVYIGTIPAESVSGRSLQYYIEARDGRGKPVIGNGSPTSPNIITVAKAQPASASANVGEDTPIGKKESGEITKKSPEPTAGAHKTVWLSVALGTGVGVATGHAELERSVGIQTGLAPAYLHIAPELGVYVTDHLALGIQGRLQVYTGADPQNPTLGSAATGSIAVLGRLLYFFSSDSFRGYFAFAVGGGDLRHTVDISKLRPGATDTVDSGPVFVGPALGFHYDFTENVGLVGELQTLAGFGDLTVNLDGNLGLALHL